MVAVISKPSSFWVPRTKAFQVPRYGPEIGTTRPACAILLPPQGDRACPHFWLLVGHADATGGDLPNVGVRPALQFGDLGHIGLPLRAVPALRAGDGPALGRVDAGRRPVALD